MTWTHSTHGEIDRHFDITRAADRGSKKGTLLSVEDTCLAIAEIFSAELPAGTTEEQKLQFGQNVRRVGILTVQDQAVNPEAGNHRALWQKVLEQCYDGILQF